MKNLLAIFFTLLLSSIAICQSNWYEIPTGSTKKLNAISFPTNNIGYIVGNDSLILKTINGGQTWESLGMNGIAITSLDDDFSDVYFVDENVGFLIAGYSGVYRTLDGAQTWSQVGSDMCFPRTILPTDVSNYLIGGNHCFQGAQVNKVVNNALSVSSVANNFFDFETILEMSFAEPNRGLAAVRSKYVLRTVDAGTTWDTIPTGIAGELTSIIMIDDLLCYAGYRNNGGPDGILKSTDGGLTWGYDPNLGTSAQFINPNYLSICSAQNGDIYSGAVSLNSDEGVIFETADGIIWSNAYVDQPINDMASHGSDITFGVGDSGYVVVNTPIASLGVAKENFLEFSAYPNPVLNELTVQNPNSEKMEVKILDASGRVLKDKFVQAGFSSIDCSDLTDGLYFLKVRIGDRSGIQELIKL